MTDDLRARLSQQPTEDLVQILRERDADTYRLEVFPIVEALLRARGVDPTAIEKAAVVLREEPEVGDVAIVTTLSNAIDAELLRSALESAGIEGWLSNEQLASVHPPLAAAQGISVIVRDTDLETARELMRDVESGASALPEELEPCPRCGSLATARRRQPDRGLAVSAFALTGVPLPAGDWRWRCSACAHEWT